MIQKIWEKIKGFPRLQEGDIWLVFIIILAILAAFGLGRLSVLYEKSEKPTIVCLEGEGFETCLKRD